MDTAWSPVLGIHDIVRRGVADSPGFVSWPPSRLRLSLGSLLDMRCSGVMASCLATLAASAASAATKASHVTAAYHGLRRYTNAHAHWHMHHKQASI